VKAELPIENRNSNEGADVDTGTSAIPGFVVVDCGVGAGEGVGAIVRPRIREMFSYEVSELSKRVNIKHLPFLSAYTITGRPVAELPCPTARNASHIGELPPIKVLTFVQLLSRTRSETVEAGRSISKNNRFISLCNPCSSMILFKRDILDAVEPQVTLPNIRIEDFPRQSEYRKLLFIASSNGS
jgi:hypothetical protein